MDSDLRRPNVPRDTPAGPGEAPELASSERERSRWLDRLAARRLLGEPLDNLVSKLLRFLTNNDANS